MVFIIARQNDKIVAGTINLAKHTHFYGRLKLFESNLLFVHNVLDIGEPFHLWEIFILKHATMLPSITAFNGT